MNISKLVQNSYLLWFKMSVIIMTMALLLIAIPEKKSDGVKPPAEFYITLDWPSDKDVDLDLWVRDPFDNVVNYVHKESKFTTLDRDVIGWGNDEVAGVDGKAHRVNQEFVTIRSEMEGEYVVSVVLYNDHNNVKDGSKVDPVPFKVALVKLNPAMKILTEFEGSVSHVKEEVHAFRFSVSKDGVVVDRDRPIKLQGVFSK
jgi:hypothetical protein